MKPILALDLGTQTGWAIQRGDQIQSGSLSFKPSRFESSGMRYLRFGGWLEQLRLKEGTIHCLYFEAVRRHLGTEAAHVYGGLLAIMMTWCERHNVLYQGIAVGTIKKQITGKGNASKQAVIQALQAQGFAPIDDNEADALAILLTAKQQDDSNVFTGCG